jgi:hypothetical protein
MTCEKNYALATKHLIYFVILFFCMFARRAYCLRSFHPFPCLSARMKILRENLYWLISQNYQALHMKI